MSKCPSCGKVLNEKDLRTQQCIECGAWLTDTVEEGTVDAEGMSGLEAEAASPESGKETVDVDAPLGGESVTANLKTHDDDSNSIHDPSDVEKSTDVEAALPDSGEDERTVDLTQKFPVDGSSDDERTLDLSQQFSDDQITVDSQLSDDAPESIEDTVDVDDPDEDDIMTADLGDDAEPSILAEGSETVIDPNLADPNASYDDDPKTVVDEFEDEADLSSQATVPVDQPATESGPQTDQSVFDDTDTSQTINTRDLSTEDADRWSKTILSQDTDTGPDQPDSKKTEPIEPEVTEAENVQPQTRSHRDETEELDSQTQLVIQPREMSGVEQARTATADYELLELLGEGGMGVVYAANQTSIDREVAVKMLKAKHVKQKKQRDSFLTEAVVTGDLDHPNIVPIYDVARNESDALFYSMKRVKGTPWRDIIRTKSLSENVEILMKTADAIAFAHSRGVVHRDLKPENIMLGDYGEVLVMDWGLALITNDFAKTDSIIPSRSMGCTPAYAAPELLTGPRQRIGSASDIYLLGAMLYQIITGNPPHRGKNVLQCLSAASENRIQPTEKSGELLDIALEAMQTAPEDRYASVKDFQTAIRLYQSHSESLALSSRAEEDLTKAGQTNDYDDYAQAVYGFREALELWDGNTKAKNGLANARLAYARCAQGKGDYDLGMSLLDTSPPEHAQLYRELQTAKAEVDARAKRLKTAMRVGQALVASIAVIVTGAAFWINSERAEAVKQRGIALVNEKEAIRQEGIARNERDEADRQRSEAIRQEGIAKDQRDEANRQRTIAVEAQEQEEIARRQEEIAKNVAIKAQEEEEEQRVIAENALEQEEIARREQQYEAYVAQIALADERIRDNSFRDAVRILETLRDDPESARLRNWEWHRLWYLSNLGDGRTKPTDMIDAVAFRPDGRRFVTGSQDGKARIWSTSAPVAPLVLDHGDEVRAVAYSGDGKYVATGGSDTIIRIWDAKTGERAGARELRIHKSTVTSVTFAPKQSGLPADWLLSTSFDNTAILWDVETGQRLNVFLGHAGAVSAAAFSPKGDMLVTAGTDNRAVVWTIRKNDYGSWSFEQQTEFTGHGGPVYSVAFAPDGQRVASGGHDGRVLIWDPVTVQGPNYAVLTNLDAPLPPQPESQPLEDPNQDLASRSGSQLRKKAHSAAVHSVNFSRNGKWVLSGSDDNTIKVWDAKTGGMVKNLRGHAGWVRSCVFSPVEDSLQVLSGSHDRQARIWDVDRYTEQRQLFHRTIKGHDAILSVAIDHAGQRVLTSGRDRMARIWNAKTGEKWPVQLQLANDTDDGQVNTLHEGHDFLASMVIPFDGGRKILTAAMDGSVRIWDAERATQLARLGNTGQSAAASVSPDGQWIATGSNGLPGDNDADDIIDLRDHRAKLWKTSEVLTPGAAPKPKFELPGHDSRVTALAFSPDGKYLFSGDDDGIGILWQSENGRRLKRFTVHYGRINAVAFSADGKNILTASDDHTVLIWDRQTAEVRQTLTHPDSVTTMTLVPGQSRLLTGCADRNIRLWDFASGQGLKVFSVRGDQKTVAENVRRWMRRRTLYDGRLLDIEELAKRSGLTPQRIAEIRAAQVEVLPQELDQLARALGLETAAELTKPSITGLAVSPDGRKLLATNPDDGIVHVWDLKTAQEISRKSDLGALWTAVYYRSGQNVVAAGPFKLLTVGGDGARLWTFRGDQQAKGEQEKSYSPHASVTSAAFSRDGKYVVTGSSDRTIKIWDSETGESLLKLPEVHTDQINHVVFSPRAGSYLLLTASDDRTAILWQWNPAQKSANLIRKFTGHADSVSSAVFSADEKLVLTTSQDGTARIWDPPKENKPIELKNGHTGAVLCGAFAPDGGWVVTGGEDRTARLWDVASGIELKPEPMSGHTAGITTVAVSPDGTRILTGSRDGTAKLWDPRMTSEANPPAEGDANQEAADRPESKASREILTLRGHDKDVTSVAFSPDGLNGPIVTGSLDGKAILWLADKPKQQGQKVAGK